jgi:hypothetical protein
LRCAWYRRTTSGAEGKIGLTRMAAGSTGEWLLRAASRTESKTALNIKPAAAALHRTHLTKPRCTAISAATSRPQTGNKHEPADPGPQALNKRRIWRQLRQLENGDLGVMSIDERMDLPVLLLQDCTVAFSGVRSSAVTANGRRRALQPGSLRAQAGPH